MKKNKKKAAKKLTKKDLKKLRGGFGMLEMSSARLDLVAVAPDESSEPEAGEIRKNRNFKNEVSSDEIA